MTLISLIKASKDFGIKSLFKNLDLHIKERERLGLIGANGSGKSTLLKVIAGIEPLPEGQRRCSANLRIEIVDQDTSIDSNLSILEAVLQGCDKEKDLLITFNEISQAIAKNPNDKKLLNKFGEINNQMDAAQAWDLERQCKEILRRLGIKDLDQPIKKLSGGYKKRIALASALVANPDVLLLDEPTNHLDTSAVEWLQNWLEKFQGALILVTHDRYVLDQVTQRMVEINNGQIGKYQGNYASFLAQKVQEQTSAVATNKKFNSILRKELAWLKQGPKARSTKQKARIQRIAQMKANNSLQAQDSLEILSSNRRIGKIVIEATNIQLSIDQIKEYKILFDDFSYSFSPEDRVGFIGENGTGKSSLLDLFAGKIKPSKGTIKVGETVHIGYLDQHTDQLFEGKGVNRKVIEFIEESAQRINFDSKSLTASQLLERFLFTPAQQHSPLSKLSGGEKRRLSLCKILIERPNILLLDEPTNDLDIDTLSVLEDFIEEFKGCVIIVSHDRYFLDRTVDRIFNIEDGEIIRYETNYSGFLKQKLNKKNAKINHQQQISTKKDTKNNYRNNINKSNKISYKETIELEDINKRLPLLEEKKTSIEKKIFEAKGNISKISLELAETIEKINELEERWFVLNDKLIMINHQ